MKKRVLYLLFAITVSLSSLSVTASAVGEGLDEVIKGNQTAVEEQVETESVNKGATVKKARAVSKSKAPRAKSEFAEGLAESSNLTGDMKGANEATEGARGVVAAIVNFIAYTLPVVLVLRVAIDLVYIGVPFLRNILSNGNTGAAPASSGMSGGFGGGMLGGGMSGGFGHSSSGMGGGQQAKQGGGMQWVSDAALNAVAADKGGNTNDKKSNVFKAYAKDMIVVLVIIPVFLTLAITGVLTSLGFALGDLVVNGIQRLQGMI